MHEDDPMRPAGHKGRLRADMWTEALARHEAGRLRATELRSSDYFGPGTTPRTSYLGDIVVDPGARGPPARSCPSAAPTSPLVDLRARRRPARRPCCHR